MRSLRRAVLGVVLTVALTACGAQDDSGDGDGRPSGTLTVFAAASLTDVFTELGDRLMAENPDLQVRFTRSEEHTSELQSRQYLVCRLLLEKKTNHQAP